MRVEFRLLRGDCRVDIAQFITGFAQQLHGTTKQDFTVDVFVFARMVGEVITDIAHIGRAEQGVADGMDQHVGITVPQQSRAVLDTYAAEPQLTPFGQSMYVISESDTHSFQTIAG